MPIMNSGRLRRLGGGLLASIMAWMPAALTAGEAADLPAPVALLGAGVVLRAIEAPVMEKPALWLGRPAGRYRFTYVEGGVKGKPDQVEEHQPDPVRPELAWRRHIGDAMTEHLEVQPDFGIRHVEETDHTHGYRVTFEPGVAVPPGAKKGDTWQTDSELTAYEVTRPSDPSHRGKLRATRRYVGAYRVRVPAGEFDTVLLEETYDIQVGPLKASDTRHVFYARGVGIVAEVEGMRASALIVFRVQEKSARVLMELPPAGN